MDLITAAKIAAITLTFSIAALNLAKAALAVAKAYRTIIGKPAPNRPRTARK